MNQERAYFILINKDSDRSIRQELMRHRFHFILEL